MNWKKESDPSAFDAGPVTTREDILMQRRLREEIRPFPLDRVDELSPSGLFFFTPNHRTSRGWEPFDLQRPRGAVNDRETGGR
jgi:hypothetical protein